MRILVFPKDQNPYQELLYSEMRKLGVRVTYLGRLTPFHGVSIALIPLETAIRRLLGARVIHIHWVAPFMLPGSRRFSFMRRMSQAWFGFWLRTATRLGISLVWTAHNVLPHDSVFTDDVAARRALVKASDLVIVHSEETSVGLARIGATLHNVVVIPHGPFAASRSAGISIGDAEDFDPFRFLFVGQVKPYKGVDELLAAFQAVPPRSRVHLTIAGQCNDPELLDRLRRFENDPAISMHIAPERLPESALSAFLAEAHVVVLPFRNVTTSGSAILAISHGKPIIVPESANMIDIPESAAIRYDGTRSGLVSALTRTASMSMTELSAMSEAALKHAHSISWEEIAIRTKAEMVDLRNYPSPARRGRHS